MITNC